MYTFLTYFALFYASSSARFNCIYSLSYLFFLSKYCRYLLNPKVAPITNGLKLPKRVFILIMKVFENTVSVNAESALLNMLFPALLAIFVSLLVFSRRNM
jgi:hypothetical protein